MTTKYWIRIAIGMALIFLFGMMVDRGISRGKDLIERRFPTSVLFLGADFKVGDRVGDINRLQLMRSRPREVDSAIVSVKLRDSSQVSQFSDCRLTAIDSRGFNQHTRFACSSPADSVRLELVPFGHVVIQPGDKHLTLWVPSSTVASFRRDAFDGGGSNGDGDIDMHTENGTLQVLIDGQEILRTSGDSAGGSFVFRDAKGRVLVEISGDDKGGGVRVMDSNGRVRINIGGKKDTNH